MPRFGRAMASVAMALLVIAMASLASVAEAASPASDVMATSEADAFAPVGRGLPFSIVSYPYRLRELTVADRPFSSSTVIPRVDNGVHDEHGVRMRIVRGRMYQFPRGQATYGLVNLNSYRLTGDAFFLDRALKQANRLIDTRDLGGEAWYYPNYPSRYRHGRPGEPCVAPYYSALPQGRILMLFSRLFEITGEVRWRNAAERTFLAYLRLGPRSGPYVVNRDADHYYWLQEWPWAGLVPDCTFNGHNSSLFGLYEYWIVTRDVRARSLFRGAITTSRHYLGAFRCPGWISCYCLAHRGHNPNYHEMHAKQLLTIYSMTGAAAFARAADAFENDYPKPAVDCVLRVTPGRYVARRFDAEGRVTARHALRIRRTVAWRATRRQRQRPGSAVYLRIAGGALAGYWLAERPARVYLRGMAARLSYFPPRRLTIRDGVRFVAVDFDGDGNVTASIPTVAGERLVLSADRRAVANGYARVRIAEGELAGYWVRLRRGIELR